MLANISSNTSRSVAPRVMRRIALAGSAVSALIFLFPAAALPQGKTLAFAGTWGAVAAVDDREQRAVIIIRRKGEAYELIDSDHPPHVLRGRAIKGRLTFVQKGSRETTTFVYTMPKGGNTLKEDVYTGGTHLSNAYERMPRSPKKRRLRRQH